MVYDLADSEVLIEYVNHYVATHPSIAPAGEFTLSDADYEDFVKTVAESGFTYTRRTEEMMKVLESAARFEGCYDDAADEFKALAGKMQGNVHADMERFKDKIRTLLELEIVTRYYFRKGTVRQQLRNDEDVKAAIELLSDPARYENLL